MPLATAGADPDRLKWYAQAELTNGRWVRAVSGLPVTAPLALDAFSVLGLSCGGQPSVTNIIAAESIWYVQAMAAVAGILFTEATGNPVKWFEAGAAEYNISTPAQARAVAAARVAPQAVWAQPA